jgi:hypothetical protein
VFFGIWFPSLKFALQFILQSMHGRSLFPPRI